MFDHARRRERYGKAIAATVAGSVAERRQKRDPGRALEWPQSCGRHPGLVFAAVQSLRRTTATAVDAAMHATGPGAIVKFLFTSGSAGCPNRSSTPSA